MADKLRIAVCHNLRAEVEGVVSAEGWDDVFVVGFPPTCNHAKQPARGASHLPNGTSAEGSAHAAVVAGALCVGRMDATGRRSAGQARPVDHCSRLFLPSRILDGYLDRGCFVVTPGWLAHWRDYLESWGFRGELAREFFQESATRLVLLDTGVELASSDLLRQFSEHIGLPWEIAPVGLDLFRLHVAMMVSEWRLEMEQGRAQAAYSDAYRESAELAMAYDVMGRLAGATTEEEAIGGMLGLFTSLFAAGDMAYLPVVQGCPAGIVYPRGRDADRAALARRLDQLSGDYGWSVAGEGFVLRVSHQAETVGLLQVDHLAFPEHREHYLNLALIVGRVCGLAVSNARAYEQVVAGQAERERLMADIERRARELEATVAELRRLEEQREDLLRMVGHDLRSPLTGVQGQAQILRRLVDRPGQEAQMRRSIAAMLTGTRRMNTMIQDLVDAARMESGQLRLESATVDLRDLLRDLVHRLEAAAEAGRIVLEVPEGLPRVWADPDRLERVLTNLIANSLKYSDAEVRVRAEALDGEVQVSVVDRGTGVAPEDLPRIFERFYRASGARGTEGLGLGLYISRMLVEAMGGRIRAESEPDKGSTFSFTVPIAGGATTSCPGRSPSPRC